MSMRDLDVRLSAVNVNVLDNTECSDELAIRGTDMAYLIYKGVHCRVYFHRTLSRHMYFFKQFLGAIPSQNQLVTYANLRLTQRQ